MNNRNNINEKILKKYGQAKFVAGFYLCLNLLNNLELEKEIIEKYKALNIEL